MKKWLWTVSFGWALKPSSVLHLLLIDQFHIMHLVGSFPFWVIQLFTHLALSPKHRLSTRIWLILEIRDNFFSCVYLLFLLNLPVLKRCWLQNAQWWFVLVTNWAVWKCSCNCVRAKFYITNRWGPREISFSLSGSQRQAWMFPLSWD